VLQGAVGDDSSSDNMLLRGCKRTNCSPAGGSTVHCKTTGFRPPRLFLACGGLDSTVGIATRYSLDGPGFVSRWKRDFTCRPDRPQAPRSLLYNRYGYFWGIKRPECGADHPSPSFQTNSNLSWLFWYCESEWLMSLSSQSSICVHFHPPNSLSYRHSVPKYFVVSDI
jgi:hypothetical protein